MSGPAGGPRRGFGGRRLSACLGSHRLGRPRLPACLGSDRPRRPRLPACLAAAALLPLAPPPSLSGQGADFWSSTAPIALTFEADFRTLRNEDRRPGAPLRPAAIVVDATGVRVPALIRTRGNFRLRRSTCVYPPLRVRIDDGSLPAGGVPPELEGLGNARLVSPCNGSDPDLIWLEYLAYRIWSLISNHAYSVRPLEASFVDTSGRDGVRRVDAFMLEGDGHLTRRLGLDALSDSPPALVDARALDRDARTTLEIFQYLIGNTDWSVTVRHNVFVAWDGDRLVAIPYDFDFSGLVDAPYAAPDPRFGSRSVTDRIFHGACRTDGEFRSVLRRFTAVREDIYRELDGLALSSRRRAKARRFIQDFYREAEGSRILRAFRATCL